MESDKYDYIVVGSGAGGGTVAARLAESGCKVLVLEAGGDPMALQGGDAAFPDDKRLPQDYEVPVFHPFSTENEAMSWGFFVRHYDDLERQAKDPKFESEKDGVFYPRAGVLGGCTSHNAMITVYPHEEDWEDLAYRTGDASWNAKSMRRYFQRLENCHHRPFFRWLAKFGLNPTRHGFNGWLPTEKAIPVQAALKDKKLIFTLVWAVLRVIEELGHPLKRFGWLLRGLGDPNDWRLVKKNSTGLRYPPLTTRKHARHGTRERLLETKAAHPDNLHIELNALVSRVLFDEDNRAIGVEYQKGERLYQAHAHPAQEPGEMRSAGIQPQGEVILAGGAYNTPQMLMLSGIGPREHLAEFDIACRADLPVGRNLQDRYEVGVVFRKIDPKTGQSKVWEVLKGAKFSVGDPQYQMWKQRRKGVYTTNGAVLAAIKRSDPSQQLPDLFCFSLLGKFRGYFTGYSKLITETHYLTWAILKAHTSNTAGYIKLRSGDPRVRPYISFRYFDEGNGLTDSKGREVDANAVVAGIRFVRDLINTSKDTLVEEFPGANLSSDEELREFVKNHAWGHHASCSCPIGPEGGSGVLNSRLSVYGVKGLRVVDASAFPKIPGFFIATSIYMLAEKAADMILQDAGRQAPPLPSPELKKSTLLILAVVSIVAAALIELCF